MRKHNPDQVAAVASMLLQGKFDVEPHHIRQAVASARLVLDEAGAGEAIEEAPADHGADGENHAD